MFSNLDFYSLNLIVSNAVSACQSTNNCHIYDLNLLCVCSSHFVMKLTRFKWITYAPKQLSIYRFTSQNKTNNLYEHVFIAIHFVIIYDSYSSNRLHRIRLWILLFNSLKSCSSHMFHFNTSIVRDKMEI